ncbi:hypothetical protein TNIN_216761 [Trichonephila inaurata madagascariensis]|uniref:Uncharacterized protein n=1 Tax=Trichonephila inaurata madagascariensis TaxID=2747483 RepID=A0A8X6IEV5_9ARAC|nr:hypothetical protein TNIN_216761 [Trichonephila inaurata madagascariensis]
MATIRILSYGTPYAMDSEPESIPHAKPEKKSSLHIDLRIERASNMIQNLSCSENSQPERKNSNEFDWKRYMQKEYDEIEPNELEQNLDAHDDEALNLRNETDEISFIDPNINNTNSEGI